MSEIKSDLEWEIEYEMEDLRDDADHIFDVCRSDIRNAYWPVRKIFADDRAEKLAEERALWIISYIGHLEESPHKIVLRKNLYFVFNGDHDWFGEDNMPKGKDEVAQLMCSLDFDNLLGALEDTICYNCR